MGNTGKTIAARTLVRPVPGLWSGMVRWILRRLLSCPQVTAGYDTFTAAVRAGIVRDDFEAAKAFHDLERSGWVVCVDGMFALTPRGRQWAEEARLFAHYWNDPPMAISACCLPQRILFTDADWEDISLARERFTLDEAGAGQLVACLDWRRIGISFEELCRSFGCVSDEQRQRLGTLLRSLEIVGLLVEFFPNAWCRPALAERSQNRIRRP